MEHVSLKISFRKLNINARMSRYLQNDENWYLLICTHITYSSSQAGSS